MEDSFSGILTFSFMVFMIWSGALLRKKISFLQFSLLPASIVGGLLGFVLISLDWSFNQESENFVPFAFHFFTLSFMSLALIKENKDSPKPGPKVSTNLGALWLSVAWTVSLGMQALVGLIGISLYNHFSEQGLPESLGMLVTHGFTQGPGQALNTSPLYKLPFGQVFIRAVSTPSIGTAQGALDAYCEYNSKRLNSVGQKVVESPAGQIAGARALSAIRTARLKLHHAFDTLLEYAEKGEPYRDIDRAEFRYDSCNTVETLIPVVQELLANSGGTAIYQGNTVNELYQDILAFRQHAANQPYAPTTNLGSVMFGEPSKDFFS